MNGKFFRCITNISLVFLMLISHLSFTVYGEDTQNIETEKITVTIYLDDGFSIKDSDKTIINSIVKEDAYITPVDIYLDEDMADSFSDDLVSCLNEYDIFKNNNLVISYDKDNHMLTISGTPKENVEINLNDILSEIIEKNNEYDVEEISSDGAIIYVSSSGDDSNNGYSAESPVQDLATAYSKVTDGGSIILLCDITLNSTLDLNTQDKKVTIKSNSYNTYSIKRADNFTGTLLNITKGTVNLEDIVLDGQNISGENDQAIKVEGGILYINSDAVVKNFETTKNDTSTITINGGSLFLNGGSITNNKATNAGGIYLKSGDDKGWLVLNCGEITNNSGTIGGVYVEGTKTEKTAVVIGSGDSSLIIFDNKDVSNNASNLKIDKGRAIQRSSESSILKEASKIGISLNEYPTSGDDKIVVSRVSETEKDYFICDDTTKAGILYTDNKLYLSADYRDAKELYVNTTYSGTSQDGTIDHPYKSIETAYNNAVDGDTIVLLNSFYQGSQISINKDIEVTLTSYGDNTYTITRNKDCNLFNISKGTLTLKNIILSDSEGKSGRSRTKALILVGSNSELVLDDKATITGVGMNNLSSGTEWGVIVVGGGSGTLTMKDGSTIKDCIADSGPVRLGNDGVGKFNMNGGTIENCASHYKEGSAVYISAGSIMNMSGGVIKNCGNSSTTGTIYLHNSNTNIFAMTGGEITSNSAVYGGGVYSNNNNNNIIKISGTAKIYGNTGTFSSLNGESNIYLSSGQTITIGEGGMQNGANVGIYTCTSPTNSADVKFATNASSSDANYFHSDKLSIAGVLYCNGTSDTITGHHTHTSDTLWLSTAVANYYTVNITNIDGITITGDLIQNSINNSSKTFSSIELFAAAGYQDFTNDQLNALNNALGATITDGAVTSSDSGLYAILSDEKIIIKAVDTGLKKDVSIDLADIFNEDNALKSCEAKIGNNYYSTLSAALDVASSNSDEDTIIIKNTTVTSVDNKQLKANDILQDINDNTYKAIIESTISVDSHGNVTLNSGKLDVEKKTGDNDNASVSVNNNSNSYEVSGDLFSINTDTNGIGLSVGSDNSASINNISFKDGDFSISKNSDNNIEIKGITNSEGNYGGTVTGTSDSGVIEIVDGDTTITADSDGKIKLTSGSGKSNSNMTSTIGSNDKTFTSVDSSSYTVNATSNKLTLNGNSSSDYSVKMDSDIVLAGKGGSEFIFGSDGSNMNVCVSKDASISNDAVTINGVEDATVGIIDDSLVLVSGKGQVTGEATVKVKLTNDNKIVDVTVPSGKTYIIDTNDKGVVSGLTIGNTVVVDGVTYTSGTSNSSFVLDNEYARLTNINDKILIPSAKNVSTTLGDDNGPIIIVPSSTDSNTGETTITKTSTGATVTLNKENDTFKIGNNIYVASSDDTSFDIDNDGNVKLNSGSAKLNPNCSIVGGSGKTIENTSNNSDVITVKADSSKDTITISNGDKVKIGDTEYKIASNNTVIEVTLSSNKISSGVVMLDKDESIDIDDFTVSNNTDDNSKVISVNAGTDNKGTISILSGGKATIGNGTNEVTIESENDTTITITDDGILKAKMPIKISGVEYTNNDSSAELSIDLSSGKAIVTVPNATKASDGSANIIASNDNTKISKIDDSLTLISGKGQVTGQASVAVKISDEKTVNVTVSSDKTVTLDTLEKTVSNLEKDVSVTVDDITYVSGSDSGSFSLENIKLTNDGDKVNIIGSLNSDKTVAVDDSLNIIVLSEDEGDVTITKTSTGATVNLNKTNDKFKLGENIYTSAYDNTTYSISDDGNVAEIFKMLKDGESYTGSSNKTIVNPTNSNNDEIKVTINNSSENIDALTIPGNGKVKISDTEYENASLSEDLIIEVANNANELISGSVKLDKEEDINITVTEGSDSKTLTIKNTDISTSDNSVVVEAIKGSGEDLNKKTAKITLSGSVSVEIGDKVKITNDSTNSSDINIDSDGKLSVNVPITINGISYTGDDVTTITIDSSTGKVISVSGSLKIDESALEDPNFSYEIKPNQSVIIGKYVYTNENTTNNVTINSRGKDDNDKILNPTIVLKDFDDKVKVALKDETSNNTTYTAAASNTKFAMSKSDEDTKNIDLLDNGATANSGVKNINGVIVNGGDNSIKAIDDDAQIELKNNKATLVSGKGSSYGKITATINGNDKDFESTSTDGSYEVNISDSTLKVNSNSSVKSDGITYKSGNYKFNDDKTIIISGSIEIADKNNSIMSTGSSNPTIKIDDEGNIELTSGSAIIKGEVKVTLANIAHTFISDGSYTINKSDNKLSVPSGVTVTDENGTKYVGLGEFVFNSDEDKTISVADGATITSKDGGNGSSIIGISDASNPTTIKVDDGNVTLVGGKGKSTGKMFVKFKNIDIQSINGDGVSYTVDASETNSSITLNSGTKETKASLELNNNIKLIGKEDDKFTLDINEQKTTITIPNKARIIGKANSTIEGNTNTGIEIDNEGNLTLVSGGANVIGLSNIDVKYTTSDFTTKTVKVSVPTSTIVAVDTTSKEVTGLSKNESVRIGNVIYTASDNSSFDLEDTKLTNNNEVAIIPGEVLEDLTIDLVDDDNTLNITVPYTNSGDVSITKNSPSLFINLSKKNDKFTIDNTTYISNSDNTSFSIDNSGNVKLISGSTLLNEGEGITGISDKKITNNSNDVLTVTSDASKDKIHVPTKGTKLKIDDIEYTIDSDNTTISVDKDNNIKLISGSIILEDEQSIIGINSNKLIKNPGASKLIVAIDDLKDVVTILNKDNKVKISDREYESASDNTKIEMTANINRLISGSIKLEKDKSITGSSGKLITNIGDSMIVVSGDGTNDKVDLFENGKVRIGGNTYTAKDDTTILVKDEGINVIDGSLKKNIVNTGTGINSSANNNMFNYFLLMLVSVFVVIKLIKLDK